MPLSILLKTKRRNAAEHFAIHSRETIFTRSYISLFANRTPHAVWIDQCRREFPTQRSTFICLNDYLVFRALEWFRTICHRVLRRTNFEMNPLKIALCVLVCLLANSSAAVVPEESRDVVEVAGDAEKPLNRKARLIGGLGGLGGGAGIVGGIGVVGGLFGGGLGGVGGGLGGPGGYGGYGGGYKSGYGYNSGYNNGYGGYGGYGG